MIMNHDDVRCGDVYIDSLIGKASQKITCLEGAGLGLGGVGDPELVLMRVALLVHL